MGVWRDAALGEVEIPTFLDGRVTLHQGDCLDVVRCLADSSIDSVVTDPPYGIGFMGKSWDDGLTVAFTVEFWSEIHRVLKPGGHVAAFGGTRSYHRLACAIEDAGFEIRDSIYWMYVVGFPKSHSLRDIGRPELGTALKPAVEPVTLARKPLSEKTVAANVLRWGTGAINVDGCRVEADEKIASHFGTGGGSGHTTGAWNSPYQKGDACDAATHTKGRFPANLCHDGSDEVLAAFPDSKGQLARARNPEPRGDSGSAARFFYSAKASKADRALSKHPTVKPVKLMQWVVRMVTPPGGVTLDPFAGTGTTGEAAWREGFTAVLIEREEEYQADIGRRMSLAEGKLELQRELAIA